MVAEAPESSPATLGARAVLRISTLNEKKVVCALLHHKKAGRWSLASCRRLGDMWLGDRRLPIGLALQEERVYALSFPSASKESVLSFFNPDLRSRISESRYSHPCRYSHWIVEPWSRPSRCTTTTKKLSTPKEPQSKAEISAGWTVMISCLLKLLCLLQQG